MIFPLLGIHDDEVVWLAEDEDFDDGQMYYYLSQEYIK